MSATISVASLQQRLVADGASRARAPALRVRGASASPAIQPRSACTRRAHAPAATSSSSSSASSSAARACSSAPAKPFLKRVAHASRQWMTD